MKAEHVRLLRRLQIAVYLGLGIAMVVWAQLHAMIPSMRITTYLLSFYLCARALAIFIRHREQTRGPRYSQAYVQADDLFPRMPPSIPKNGSSHG